MSAKPHILLAIELPPAALARLDEHYTVHQVLDSQARLSLPDTVRFAVRAVVGNGSTEVGPALLDQLPRLGLVCMRGVGHEGVDLPAMRGRGVLVTNGAGANAETVADHAFALMLAALRDVVRNDALVRSGGWRTATTARPIAHGKRLGILGLGDIGRRIARRGEGFGMAISYHSRRAVPGSAYTYAPSPLALAEGADILIAVLPGGAGTRHVVGAAELAALGAAGVLVNVGRGSAVDSDALAAALRAGTLGAAALDVVDGEPEIPAPLLAAPNLTFTPHMAGRSPESGQAGTTLLLDNLRAFFAGEAVVTPVG